MGAVLGQQLLQVAQVMEDQVDQEIKQLERMDEDDLEAIKRRRVGQHTWFFLILIQFANAAGSTKLTFLLNFYPGLINRKDTFKKKYFFPQRINLKNLLLPVFSHNVQCSRACGSARTHIRIKIMTKISGSKNNLFGSRTRIPEYINYSNGLI